MKKLSPRAIQLLRMIASHTHDDTGVYWCPPGDCYQHCHIVEKRGSLSIDIGPVTGSGDTPILRSLAKRGLIEIRPRLNPYASAVTPAGRKALEALGFTPAGWIK